MTVVGQPSADLPPERTARHRSAVPGRAPARRGRRTDHVAEPSHDAPDTSPATTQPAAEEPAEDELVDDEPVDDERGLWCDTCEEFVPLDELDEDECCPTCGTPLGGPRRMPWKFRLMIAASVIYLGYRAYQGITWVVHHV